MWKTAGVAAVVIGFFGLACTHASSRQTRYTDKNSCDLIVDRDRNKTEAKSSVLHRCASLWHLLFVCYESSDLSY